MVLEQGGAEGPDAVERRAQVVRDRVVVRLKLAKDRLELGRALGHAPLELGVGTQQVLQRLFRFGRSLGHARWARPGRPFNT
jgi:hypothetical protein